MDVLVNLLTLMQQSLKKTLSSSFFSLTVNSNLTLQCQIPQVKGSVPQTALNFRFEWQVVGPQVTENLFHLDIIRGFPWPPPLWIYLLKQLTELRETLTFTGLLYNEGYDKEDR